MEAVKDVLSQTETERDQALGMSPFKDNPSNIAECMHW